jgi:hypothetical protein
LNHLTPSRKQEAKFSQSLTKSLQPLPWKRPLGKGMPLEAFRGYV